MHPLSCDGGKGQRNPIEIMVEGGYAGWQGAVVSGFTIYEEPRFLPSQERRVGSALRFLPSQERRSSRELKDDGPDFCTGRSCLCPLKGLELVDNRG